MQSDIFKAVGICWQSCIAASVGVQCLHLEVKGLPIYSK